MKSERRHELQQNILLTWITDAYEKIRPYATAMLALVVLVLVTWFAYTQYTASTAKIRQYGWSDFFGALQANRVVALTDVAEDNRGTEIHDWAMVAAADMKLARGCQRILEEKAVAANDIRDAIGWYKEVLQGSRVPEVRQRAYFGLARALETLGATAEGEAALTQAIENYQKLLDEWPDGPYAEIATHRLTALQSPVNQELYSFLASYEPPEPDATPALGEGMPGVDIPFDTESLTPPGDEAPAVDLDALLGGERALDAPPIDMMELPAQSVPSTLEEEAAPGDNVVDEEAENEEGGAGAADESAEEDNQASVDPSE